MFKIINFSAEEDLSLKYRLTLDYKEDLIVIKKEDSEFNKLVKRQIKKTRKKLNLTK
mgnify:CR=1 FL=1